MGSLDNYTFDLRKGLRDAACVGLSQLEEMITDVGYAWLDGYMEGILDNSRYVVLRLFGRCERNGLYIEHPLWS